MCMDESGDVPLLTTGDCILWDENDSEPAASSVRLNSNFQVEINRQLPIDKLELRIACAPFGDGDYKASEPFFV